MIRYELLLRMYLFQKFGRLNIAHIYLISLLGFNFAHQ